MKSPITKVKKAVGMNPIARAIAKQRLKQAILGYRVAVYLMDQGEPAESDYTVMATIFASTMGAMPSQSDVDYRKLKAGMSVCAQAALRGWTWDMADAVTLDNALEIVLDVFPKLPPQAANESIKRVWNAA